MRYDQISPVPPLTPVTKSIIIACVGIYFGELLLRGFGVDLSATFGLIPYAVWSQGAVWQLVTYIFLHGSPLHLLFNMLILWFFGAEIEMRLGTARFARFFFLCGIGAGVFNLFVNIGVAYLMTGGNVAQWEALRVPIIGASGAIFGILAAYGIFYADRYFLVFFLFPMRARYFVLLIAGIELLIGLEARRGDPVAHFAHLGGMAVGAAYIWWNFVRPKGGGSSASQREREELKKRFTLIVNEGKDAESRRGDDPNYWN